jgi:hypothetical protein
MMAVEKLDNVNGFHAGIYGESFISDSFSLQLE